MLHAMVANSHHMSNNTLLGRTKWAPAQRMLGRGTTILRHELEVREDLTYPCESATKQVKKLLQVQSVAMQAWQHTQAAARMSKIFKAKTIGTGPTSLPHGTLVLYFRERTSKLKECWRGPAEVIGASRSTVFLDHGGVLIKAHRDHVRLYLPNGTPKPIVSNAPAIEDGDSGQPARASGGAHFLIQTLKTNDFLLLAILPPQPGPRIFINL